MFSGSTLTGSDIPRLRSQLEAVKTIMADGQWRSIEALCALTRGLTGRTDTERAVSARLRDLRKERFGAHRVNRRSAGGGHYEYQLVLREPLKAAA